MIKKNKNIALIGIALGIIFLMTGCDSPTDKANINKWEAQASKNASAYIKEKYGYDAKVKACECGRFDTLMDVVPQSTCLVTMEYEGEEFFVRIDGDSENTDGIDSYQSEELDNILDQEVEKCIGEKPVHVELMQKSENEIDAEAFTGRGLSDPTGVSDSYTLYNKVEENPGHPYIMVYIPKDMISDIDMSKVKIAYQYIDEDGELSSHADSLEELEEYYIGKILCTAQDGKIEFMLATNKD